MAYNFHLLLTCKVFLLLPSSNGNLSGRSENIELIPGVLETETSMNIKSLITKENKYLFDKHLYDVSDGNKFFLQIDLPGSKSIIHLLKTNSDTLALYNSDFNIAGKNDSRKAKYKLGYFSKDNKGSESLAEIKPYFDSTGEIESIIKVIVKESKQTDKTRLQKDCYNEVYQALGKPSDILFENVFNNIISSAHKIVIRK